MYKLIIFSFLFWSVFFGCAKSTTENEPPPVQKYLEYELLVIDNCEYLVYGRIADGTGHHNYHVITHKGNCKNPIHKCEIIEHEK